MGFRHAIVAWVNRGAVRRWKAAVADPKAAQARALERVLGVHQGAGYLARYGVRPGMSVDQYRAALPVVRYSDLRPWVAPLVEQGSGAPETVVGCPVSMFLKTSGTTGPAKLLPVTEAYEEETGWGRKVWIERMIAEDERNGDGSHASIVSPMHEGFTPGGLPFGSNTGRIFQRQPGLVRFFAPVAYETFSLRDFELRYYLILRFCAYKGDLSTLTTANPSTVLLLCRKLVEWADQIADDTEAGRICGGPWQARLDAADWGPVTEREAALKAMQFKVKPSAKRARQIREAMRDGPEGVLRRLWPKLTSVNCWLGGHAPFYMQRLKPFLALEGGGQIDVRDPGFSASEGLFGVPMEANTAASVLHVGGPLMEFVPEEASADDGTLLAHELEQGARYRIIVTTGGGLWRYDMNDVVEVVGMHDQTPMVRFMYKAGGTLSITGEKVTEAHAIAAATRLEPPSAGRLENVCATLELCDPPRYVVAVELDGAQPERRAQDAEALAARWDALMGEVNVEYREKRASGRLAPPVARITPEGAFGRWRARRVAEGAPDGQVKLPPLMRSLDDLESTLMRPADSKENAP